MGRGTQSGASSRRAETNSTTALYLGSYGSFKAARATPRRPAAAACWRRATRACRLELPPPANGGTNAATTIALGSPGWPNGGRYLLSGGLLQINGGLDTAAGTLTAAAAQPNRGGPSLDGRSPGARGHGSTSLSIGPNSLVIVPPGFDPSAAFQAYANLGLTHTLGTTLTVSAGTGFGGSGTIMDPVVCQGTIAASPSGAIILMNGFRPLGHGKCRLGNGLLARRWNAVRQRPCLGMSGGSLSMNNLVTGLGHGRLHADGRRQFSS